MLVAQFDIFKKEKERTNMFGCPYFNMPHIHENKNGALILPTSDGM